MVDSEDLTASTGHLLSIAEDEEYFRKMWSLVPPLQTVEMEPADDVQDKAVSKMKNNAQKEKKREKHRKKEKPINNEVAAEETQQPPKKHGRDEETEYTGLKQKKQKVSGEKLSSTVNHSPASSTVNHTPASSKVNHMPSDLSNLESTSCLKDLPSKPCIKSSAGQNIPVKQKHKDKHGVDKPSVQNSKQISDDTSTVSDAHAGPSTSRVKITGDFTETDMLQATSINSIEDKREKLRAKIAGLQAKRNPTNRERFERKKLKRQESKMKLKQKRKLEKLQKKQNKQDGDGEGSSPSKGNLNKGATTPVKPVYNKEGQMVFSKFDFTDSAKKEKKQSDLHGKDYKRLLEKIEKRNEKINKVKSKDESAGKALEEKFKWESALHKAEGEKVKDNPELLKKALKRKQKIKEQKKNKWENRANYVDKMKDDRQKKRNENIQKRKQNVKENKMQKLKKKGRMIPGF